MKLLLDENLPHRLRRLLAGHDVFTVAFMQWDGITNGELLALAASDGFDAFITKDTSLSYQQNLAILPCAVFILHAASNSLNHIAPLVPELLRQLSIMQRCTVVHIHS